MFLFRQSTFIQIIFGAISLLLIGGFSLTIYHVSKLQSQQSELNRLTAEQVFQAEHISHLSIKLLSDPSIDSLWNDLMETKNVWAENQKAFNQLASALLNASTTDLSLKNSLEGVKAYREKVSVSVDALFLEFDEISFQNHATNIQQNTFLFSKGMQSFFALYKARLDERKEIWQRAVWWLIITLLSLQLVNISLLFLKTKELNFKQNNTKKGKVANSAVTVSSNSEIRLKHSLNIQKTINDNLRNAKNTAEEISKAKVQFITTLSHEIRNPINAILGLSDLLRDTTSPEDQEENLKNLHFSAQHLRALIDNILDLGKIEANRIELVISPIELLQTAKGVMQGYKSAADERGIDLELNIDPNLPIMVMGDKLKLSQILNNLVSNAIKFTLQGYIQISLKIVEEKEHTIVVGFDVKDTGVGIPHEKLETLFDEFTQVKNDISHKFGGTGLGLTITKKLVELLGGSIKVDSGPNQNTTFSFEIEFEKVGQVIPTIDIKKIEVSSRNLAGLSVLVAEDDQLNQVVIRQFLKKWKAQFDLVDNGALAVQFINQKSYDVVLMDVNMPVLDGVSATSLIRKAGIATPIIALTGSAESEFVEELSTRGFTDVAVKPFVPEDLFLLLKTYLSTKTEGVE